MIRVTGAALRLIAMIATGMLVDAATYAATPQPEWILESNRQAEALLQ